MAVKLFVYGEQEAAEASGIHVKNLQASRIKHLKQGVHWDLFEQRVAYSKDGLVAVLQKTTGELPSAAMLSEVLDLCMLEQKKGEPAAIQAKLVRFYINPHRVQIELPDGKKADLRIKNRKNFRRGMICPVRFKEDAGLYVLTRREPRFPGRW